MLFLYNFETGEFEFQSFFDPVAKVSILLPSVTVSTSFHLQVKQILQSFSTKTWKWTGLDHKYFHRHLGELHTSGLEEHPETEAGDSGETNDQQRGSVGKETEGGEKMVPSVLSDIARFPHLSLSHLHVLPPLGDLQGPAPSRLQSPLMEPLLLWRLLQLHYLQLLESAI